MNLIEVFVKRINQVQPFINCACVTCFDDALEVRVVKDNVSCGLSGKKKLIFKEAAEVDRILAMDKIPEDYSEENKPLLGIPFSCKESIFVKSSLKNLYKSKCCD